MICNSFCPFAIFTELARRPIQSIRFDVCGGGQRCATFCVFCNVLLLPFTKVESQNHQLPKDLLRKKMTELLSQF